MAREREPNLTEDRETAEVFGYPLTFAGIRPESGTQCAAFDRPRTIHPGEYFTKNLAGRGTKVYLAIQGGIIEKVARTVGTDENCRLVLEEEERDA